MFYFKDEPVPIPPTHLDPDQLAKVREFRASLGAEGGLYWSFKSVENFEQLVRLHLTRQLQSWRLKLEDGKQAQSLSDTSATSADAMNATLIAEVASLKTQLAETALSPEALAALDRMYRMFVNRADELPNVAAKEEEPGMLELLERIEDEFTLLAEIVDRVAEATIDIGKKMQVHSSEVSPLMIDPENLTSRDVKRQINKHISDMDQFSHRMDAELPLFKNHLIKVMDSIIQATTIASGFDMSDEYINQIRENSNAVREFHTTLIAVEEQIIESQRAVESMPRMTTTLNEAKRAVANVLQRLIEEVQNGQAMTREAKTSFASIISGE